MKKKFLLGILIITSQNIFSSNFERLNPSPNPSPNQTLSRSISPALPLAKQRETETPFDQFLFNLQRSNNPTNQQLTPPTTPHTLGFPNIPMPQITNATAQRITNIRVNSPIQDSTSSTPTQIRQTRYNEAKELAKSLLAKRFNRFRDLTINDLNKLSETITEQQGMNNLRLDNPETVRYLQCIISSRLRILSPNE